MPKIELLPYHKDLAEILKSEGDPVLRKNFLASERLTTQYQNSKEAAKRRNLALREISRQDSINAEDESSQASPVIGNPLVDLKPAENELTPQEQTILWANLVLNEYNNLPKRNSAEKRVARNLATQTARRLVQDPEDIDIAGRVWKSREKASEDKEPAESFYEEVKKVSSETIRKNWETVTPERLAQIIKTYANNVLTQDFTHDLLKSYFNNPKLSRRQRIIAYYNLALAAVDLAEDKKAITEAVRIGLFETDIFPRYPIKIEQSLFFSLPYNESDRTLQQFLIADVVIVNLGLI